MNKTKLYEQKWFTFQSLLKMAIFTCFALKMWLVLFKKHELIIVLPQMIFYDSNEMEKNTKLVSNIKIGGVA